MKNLFVSPLGFDNARELTSDEIGQVGGGQAKQTFEIKATYNNGNDAEARYDIEW